MRVANDSALELGLNIIGETTLYLKNWNISGSINKLEVQSIIVIANKVNVDTEDLRNTINSALLSYITSINSDYLSKGIALPNYDNFNLTDSNLRTGKGFLYFMTKPKLSYTIDDLYNYLG